jgi:uncharacterized protein (TIGR03546 family)
MLWLNFLNRLITIMNEGATPRQISGAVALGAIIGLTPSGPVRLFVFFLLLIIDVNLSAALFSAAVFKMLAYLLDPLANSLGYALLVSAGGLKPLWTALYNMPLAPFTKFNNTLVLGSFVISLVLFLPLLVFGAKGVRVYREKYMQKVTGSRIYKLYQLTGFYQNYLKLKNLA